MALRMTKLIQNSLKKTLQMLVLSASFATIIASPTASAEQLLDKVVAVVNDQIILKSQLDSKMFEQAQSLKAQNIPISDTAALRSQVLDSLIFEILQEQRAKMIGISVSDDEINNQLQAIAQENKLSLYELRNRLNIEMANGFEKARERIEKQILIQKLREREILSQAQVTENEIQNYLKRQKLANNNTQIRLGHILIALPESATAEQREQALNTTKQLKQRIENGEDFNQLAVRHSDGARALQGGDLGWMNEQEVPTFFADAIADLSVGQSSAIIESPSGFHLIKLMDKQSTGVGNEQVQYHLYRFIVLSDKVDRMNTPQELLDITQSMDSIQDFQKLFERYPDIPKEVNAESDLGWRTLDRIPPVIQNDVAKMGAKNALPPLATDQGWMILYLDDVRKTTEASDQERKEAIQAIRSRKANEMFDLWLRRLRDEAYVQIK